MRVELDTKVVVEAISDSDFIKFINYSNKTDELDAFLENTIGQYTTYDEFNEYVRSHKADIMDALHIEYIKVSVEYDKENSDIIVNIPNQYFNSDDNDLESLIKSFAEDVLGDSIGEFNYKIIDIHK